MAPGRARLCIAAAVLVGAVATMTPVASAASSPRVMRFACASNAQRVKGVLHYLSRAAACRGRGRTLLRFDGGYQVPACRIRARRGLVRRASGLRACAAGETLMALPGTRNMWFCAARRGRALRFVKRRSACGPSELAVMLPGRERQPPVANPPLVNHAPVASDDAVTIDERTDTVITILANDTDLDGDPVLVGSIDTTGTTGSATLNGDGTVTYEPRDRFRRLAIGESATDIFTYSATDGNASSGRATVAVTVTGLNEAPAAVADSATVGEGGAVDISVLLNDSDVDRDALSIAAIDRSGTQGSVTAGGDGTIRYDPNHRIDSLAAGESGHDSFGYRAYDARAESAQVRVDVTVTGADNAPVVKTSSGSTAYTEGAAAVVIDGSVSVSDVDSANIAAARVRLSGGFQAGDELVFAAQAG